MLLFNSQRRQINIPANPQNTKIWSLEIFRVSQHNRVSNSEEPTRGVGISREIWYSNQECGRFDEKLGDSKKWVEKKLRALLPRFFNQL